MLRNLLLLIYGWLGTIQRNVITWKKDFYNHLNIEDNTDVDYTHKKKRICTDFEIKNLGEYHDLYVQSDILLLADVKVHKTYKICVLKYMNLTQLFFLLQQD